MRHIFSDFFNAFSNFSLIIHLALFLPSLLILPTRGILKTGFFNAAGFCLAATAIRDDRRVIAVILGCKSKQTRNNKAAELIESAFLNLPPLKPLETEAVPSQEEFTDVSNIKLLILLPVFMVLLSILAYLLRNRRIGRRNGSTINISHAVRKDPFNE